MKGQFICFEGLDGSGKTTIANRVANELKKKENNIYFLNKKDISFSTGYVNHHMSTIKRVLWDYSPDDPLGELGDLHWLYLNLSWFSVLENCKIKPLIDSGYTVIMDNWHYKLQARFNLKENFDHEVTKKCFDSLLKPDVTILLDIDPNVAVDRRDTISITESGNMDGFKGKTPANFVAYQSMVSKSLDNLSKEEGWIRINVANYTEEEVTKKVLNSLTVKMKGI
ncbi:MAG TPA: adenylyl-sulfate kinase [Bacillota bacterium]